MENKPKDRFELDRDKKREELEECQKSRGLKSCLNCDLTFDCKMRAAYVGAVYASMSKGATGGFDF